MVAPQLFCAVHAHLHWHSNPDMPLPWHLVLPPQDDAERDLAAAKPALDAALTALNSIQPKDITSLKALKNPPDVIKRIFDCVLLLRHW